MEEGLESLVKNFSIQSKLGDVASKLVQLKHITDRAWGLNPQPPEAMEVWGQSTQPLGDFLLVFEKKMATLIQFGLHFTRFQSPLKEQNF